jgi:hypothetical protein
MLPQLTAEESIGLRYPIQQQRLDRNTVAAPRLGQFQSSLPGQFLHGIDKFQPLVSHQEANGVAVSAATKTVIELLAGTDRERRGFFGVKRTAGHEFMTRPPQRHSAVDDLDEINPAEQLIEEFLGNAASHSHKA